MKKPDEDLSLLEIFDIPPDVMKAFDGVKTFFPPSKDWEMRTRPYYNGREKGICISLHFWGPSDIFDLHIVITNHRMGDTIISYHWLAKPEMNPITIERVPDSAFSSKFNLGYPKDSDFERGIWRIGNNIRGYVAEIARTVEVAGVLHQ